MSIHDRLLSVTFNCIVLASSGCVVGESNVGGTTDEVEPPNPVALMPASVLGGMDSDFPVFAGNTLVTARVGMKDGVRSTDLLWFDVVNNKVTAGKTVHYDGKVPVATPGPQLGSRVFLRSDGKPVSSIDVAVGDASVEYAGTGGHGVIGVVGDTLLTNDTQAAAVFASDLAAPQTTALRVADGVASLSGDALLVQRADAKNAVDVYRVKSAHQVDKEGTISADGELSLVPTSRQNKLFGGKVIVLRTAPQGKAKIVVYSKADTGFTEWSSASDSGGSDTVLAASGNLLLRAAWAGSAGDGPATLTVVDVSQKGAWRELARLPLEDSIAVSSGWSGQVAYVHTATRLLAVDARDTTAVKFVDIYSGVLAKSVFPVDGGDSPVWASGNTLVVGGGHTLVLTMSAVSGDGALHCGTVDPACFDLLRSVPNAFNNAFLYEPQYPLFSDGALKRRSLYLPPGQKINTSDPDRWVFPKGTSILKEFYSAPAPAGAVAEPLEARLWVKTGDAKGPGAWSPTVYTAVAAGWAPRSPTDNQYLDVRGYKVPHTGVCLACHQGAEDVVLGFDALQLSGGQRQVFSPGKMGASQPSATLDRLNTLAFTKAVSPTSIQGTEKAKAALGYLHSNCGSCHSDTGIASFRTLRFKHLTTAKTPQQEPGYATLIAGPSPKLVPGNAEGSPVYQRATTNMPPRFPITPIQTQDPTIGPVLKAWITELAP